MTKSAHTATKYKYIKAGESAKFEVNLRKKKIEFIKRVLRYPPFFSIFFLTERKAVLKTAPGISAITMHGW